MFTLFSRFFLSVALEYPKKCPIFLVFPAKRRSSSRTRIGSSGVTYIYAYAIVCNSSPYLKDRITHLFSLEIYSHSEFSLLSPPPLSPRKMINVSFFVFLKSELYKPFRSSIETDEPAKRSKGNQCVDRPNRFFFFARPLKLVHREPDLPTKRVIQRKAEKKIFSWSLAPLGGTGGKFCKFASFQVVKLKVEKAVKKQKQKETKRNKNNKKQKDKKKRQEKKTRKEYC